MSASAASEPGTSTLAREIASVVCGGDRSMWRLDRGAAARVLLRVSPGTIAHTRTYELSRLQTTMLMLMWSDDAIDTHTRTCLLSMMQPPFLN